MASNFLLKLRMSLKSSQPLFQRPLEPPSARFLEPRTQNQSLGLRRSPGRSRGMSGGGGWGENSSSRWRKEGPRGGEEDGRVRRVSFPGPVFAAGTAKRTAELRRRKSSAGFRDEEQLEEEVAERRANRDAGRLQPPDRPLPPAEWRTLRESLGNPPHFDIRMMIAALVAGAELAVAKSLLTFVAVETGTLSYQLLLRYLVLCVSGGHDAEVLDVYDIMRESFPSLDTGASSLFIKSFSRTARWKEAVSVLQEVKKASKPTPRNYGDIISAAVLNGDTDAAWTLYDELMESGQSPHQETWEVLFQGGVGKQQEGGEGSEVISQTSQQEKLLEILLHMRNEQIYPNRRLAAAIKTWFESLADQKWTGGWTTVTPQGVCRCCGSELESIQLTADEYQRLRDGVMADVIQGNDVFKKTTPQELERFRAFVMRKPVFDVVVDGLNVANTNKDRSKQSEMLLAVVLELERQGLSILVLGRKHMLRPSKSWNRHNMNLIQQKAHCFFTDNISEDDPFLLYATLHSGNHCRFVSRDLMRDHKACLSDRVTRQLFFKWQRGHQLVVEGSIAAGWRVRFQSVPSYDTIVQMCGDSWHIPYDDTEDRSTYEVPQRWLCLTKKA
ncbi:mitochondrial ribonuclease P catalytic subunit isoform 1-T1 [Pholidichthys leucotaenia]